MTTATTPPQTNITRVFDAPRALVYRAFTDPDHLAAWWGPIGCSLPRDLIECDVRPGGHQLWTMVAADDPALRIRIRTDLTHVVDGELLDGVQRVSGELPDEIEPFETRVRLEFHDEGPDRTRLELRQWLPENAPAGSDEGWLESFTKLDAQLAA